MKRSGDRDESMANEIEICGYTITVEDSTGSIFRFLSRTASQADFDNHLKYPWEEISSFGAKHKYSISIWRSRLRIPTTPQRSMACSPPERKIGSALWVWMVASFPTSSTVTLADHGHLWAHSFRGGRIALHSKSFILLFGWFPIKRTITWTLPHWYRSCYSGELSGVWQLAKKFRKKTS